MQHEQRDRHGPAGTGRYVEGANPLGKRNLHVQIATVDTLLQRLEGVQASGSGWRARCPSCGGKSRKLSITESCGKILLHCFGCNDAEGVLAAIGLTWADLHPPRTWPASAEERKQARRAIRECGWSSALAVLQTEATVLHMAALTLSDGTPLPNDDSDRLALACIRIERAALVLVERDTWRPDDCYPPSRLVTIKRAALIELQRQAAAAEADLARAEAGAA